MGDGAKELFATPADASRRADALLGRWNALKAQALGPGSVEREDVPKELRDRIFSDAKRFREFITRPTFGLLGAALPHGVRMGDYEKLARWYETYSKRAAELAAALPDEELHAKAKPLDLPTRDDLTWVPTLGRNLAVVLGIAGAVGVGLALVLRDEDDDDDQVEDDDGYHDLDDTLG